jgi:large subunit ribosomal protein L13
MESENNGQNLWYIIDLKGKVLGRSASEIAKILIGKNSPDYSPEKDSKNSVIAINASKIVLTGNKENSKRYYKHTGYLGNLKTVEYKELMKKSPEKIIINAVAGMLPKNLLRDRRMARLKVYASEEHPHVNVKTKVISCPQ